MKRSAYWKKEWQQKAKDKNAFAAAGAGNFARNPFEFLHQWNAVCKALRFRDSDRVLDIGCNTGLYTVLAAPWVACVDGIDFAPELVKAAKGNAASYKNIHVQKGSILKIPFRKNLFDKVMVNSVIQYLDDGDIATAFQEIARVLKPSGRAFVSLIPAAHKKQIYLDGIWKLKRTRKEKQEIYDKNSMVAWPHPGELIEIARAAGLQGKTVAVPAAVWQSWYMFSMILTKV